MNDGSADEGVKMAIDQLGIEAEVDDDDFESLEEELHLIASAIERFVHTVRDIQECARTCLPQASKRFTDNYNEIRESLDANQKILESEASPEEKLVAARELRKAIRKSERFQNDATVSTLERSLFIGMFTCFDSFVGELLEGVYSVCPELYKALGSQYTAAEVLEYDTLGEFKVAVLEKEIETIRRKSYGEQFKEFERRFKFESLTKFDSWPLFIEASQRRNLFTHCNGIVSQQYLKVCAEAGYKIPEDCEIGKQLSINVKYFWTTSRIITEVGVMLGHTVWRKLLESERRKADSELNYLIYDFLQLGHFRTAESLCKFASGIPKKSDDVMARMFTLNHAIAAKEIGGLSAAKRILDKKDWSAVIYDFRLARAVLLEEYEEAKCLMIRIGRKGEIVCEEAYHDWPLFRKFRERQEFLEGYETVYGVKYLTKLSEIVHDTHADTVAKAEAEAKAEAAEDADVVIDTARS
ncbi:hypothetical protein [Pseudomonas sp. B5(2017)]|uniref:hypothetical protein n=1 Tax=Pseudomonas sp. B5(2017) TaxID=1981714 RepID=UPI002115C4FB|nr:hypothetical protein [Pseudomonas sp. B5(2017)]